MGETLYDYISTFTTIRDQSNRPICTNSISDDIGCCTSIMPTTSITISSGDLADCSSICYTHGNDITFHLDNTNSVGDTDEDVKEEEVMDLHPVKIIFNDPVSVVFWEDGEKTVVRRHESEPYDKYTAFCAALAIKIFGSNTEVNRIVRGGIDQQEKDRKKAEKIKKQITDSIRKVVKSKES